MVDGTLLLPSDESQGGCYHSHVCGAHLLEEVPRDEAEDRIREEDLEPCGHCVAHHGLVPVAE